MLPAVLLVVSLHCYSKFLCCQFDFLTPFYSLHCCKLIACSHVFNAVEMFHVCSCYIYQLLSCTTSDYWTSHQLLICHTIVVARYNCILCNSYCYAALRLLYSQFSSTDWATSLHTLEAHWQTAVYFRGVYDICNTWIWIDSMHISYGHVVIKGL